jgi:hypothetical protein
MKRIEGWENYSITEDGKVFSHRKDRYITLGKHAKGYRNANLWERQKAKNFLVHRLVALAFISNPENHKEVNHIDGNKENNHVSNLEWCTRTENIKHSYDTGLYIHPKGEKWWSSKLNEEDVKYIRNNYKFRDKKFSFAAMAKDFNVSITTIIHAYYGECWSHV